MNDKQTGSFYTPEPLVKYMSEYAMQKIRSQYTLEPSAGDGRFIDCLSRYEGHIDAIEIDAVKVNELVKNQYGNVDLLCTDFVKFSIESNKKYDLIIGNPPYISKKLLADEERELSWRLTEYWDLPNSVFQNLWVSFVLGALKVLNRENGAIFFVLPFEFLQVHYAEKLRNFLESYFNLIEITTFKESVFPDIEQDVCLVYMSNERNTEPIVKYTTVKSVNDFKPLEYSEIRRNKPLNKWSNSILNDDEIELLNGLSDKFTKISDLGYISPGIVTGANSFFILNKGDSQKFSCKKFLLPIIQKSVNVSNILLFSEGDFKNLSESDETVWMLNLSGIDTTEFSLELKEYISQGEKLKLDARYKCGKRKRWFDVPVIANGDLMFFKRYNKIPRLVINNARVYTTDISYNIRLAEQYNRYSVAFCFYNSLTMTLCEYRGRFYGGGVGELVPSEFKSLCIPYNNINMDDIQKLDRMMRNNSPIEEIFDYVDSIVLEDLSTTDLKAIKKIREKYLLRRLKGKIE